jgi:hypothetical protein
MIILKLISLILYGIFLLIYMNTEDTKYGIMAIIFLILVFA